VTVRKVAAVEEPAAPDGGEETDIEIQGKRLYSALWRVAVDRIDRMTRMRDK
jgi:hypothetical protein